MFWTSTIFWYPTSQSLLLIYCQPEISHWQLSTMLWDLRSLCDVVHIWSCVCFAQHISPERFFTIAKRSLDELIVIHFTLVSCAIAPAMQSEGETFFSESSQLRRHVCYARSESCDPTFVSSQHLWTKNRQVDEILFNSSDTHPILAALYHYSDRPLGTLFGWNNYIASWILEWYKFDRSLTDSKQCTPDHADLSITCY